jgi:hypothetical protein
MFALLPSQASRLRLERTEETASALPARVGSSNLSNRTGNGLGLRGFPPARPAGEGVDHCSTAADGFALPLASSPASSSSLTSWFQTGIQPPPSNAGAMARPAFGAARMAALPATPSPTLCAAFPARGERRNYCRLPDSSVAPRRRLRPLLPTRRPRPPDPGAPVPGLLDERAGRVRASRIDAKGKGKGSRPRVAPQGRGSSNRPAFARRKSKEPRSPPAGPSAPRPSRRRGVWLPLAHARRSKRTEANSRRPDPTA